jgi:hypothetical protein
MKKLFLKKYYLLIISFTLLIIAFLVFSSGPKETSRLVFDAGSDGGWAGYRLKLYENKNFILQFPAIKYEGEYIIEKISTGNSIVVLNTYEKDRVFKIVFFLDIENSKVEEVNLEYLIDIEKHLPDIKKENKHWMDIYYNNIT